MWYVIQVKSKQEKKMLERLESAICKFDGTVRSKVEVFIPLREIMRHREGEWVSTTEIIFPGYIFVSTKDIDEVANILKDIPAFMRILGNSKKYIPLSEDEVALITALGGKDHFVRMSEGVIEGDKIRILKGPLSAYTGIICKIDRHKRVAYVELSIMGRLKKIKLGLEIIKKSA